ncbi:MAG: hypothetical protein H6867_07490 [Rhodospirillales bacterium]|nr:hypothetical protein [Rhodospirillales bacterium]MCB9995395.1 hypothetical protein [Rhodospirillales bacterium]
MKINNIIAGAFVFAMLGAAGIAIAQEMSGDFNAGSMMVGYDGRTCDGSLEGAIRYDSSSNKIEFCDSGTWQEM